LDEQVRTELAAGRAESSRGLLGEAARFWLVERPEPDMRRLKLGLGIVANASNLLVGAVMESPLAYASLGYLMERLVLKATDLGLGTCWVGHYDPKWFPELGITKREKTPVAVAVGYPTAKRTAQERVIRIAIQADRRKPWDDLFFAGPSEAPLSREQAGPYAHALEMVRLAPSAGNTQPWRIVKNGLKFDFHVKPTNPKYEERHLHDVDVGIALSHFELAARETGLKGSWNVQAPDAPALNGCRYVISWDGGK